MLNIFMVTELDIIKTIQQLLPVLTGFCGIGQRKDSSRLQSVRIETSSFTCMQVDVVKKYRKVASAEIFSKRYNRVKTNYRVRAA
jgi:hypothetical protein